MIVSRIFSRNLTSNLLINCTRRCTSVTYENLYNYDVDPGPKFLNSETQKLLKSLTRMQLDKVFRRRAQGPNRIEYKFMTTEEIEDKIRETMKKAARLLQMPPVVMIQEFEPRVISNDPALKMYDDTKHVITDITYGVPDMQRIIVVRQLDGKLETVDSACRQRINQIYFPLAGRKVREPNLFRPEFLTRCLNDYHYEFILDRACLQYEPYESEYHRIVEQVYLHLLETKKFDQLRSTRHFGPMSFFYAWHKLIDDLLIDMIERDFLRNGVELCQLFYTVQGIDYKSIEFDDTTDSLGTEMILSKKTDNIMDEIGKTAGQLKSDFVCLEFIETFIRSYGLKKSKLELAAQTIREHLEERQRLNEGLQKSHGIS